MQCTITEGHFGTEQEALDEVTSRGWTPYVLDMIGADEEFHFHDFETVAFVLEGTAMLELKDGEILTAGPGSRAEVPAGLVHRDVPGSTYRGVLGFSVELADMTQPVNKPVDE